MNEHFLWVEKYRPHRVQDLVLTSATKAVFQRFVDERSVPNLMLCGTPGTGKTSAALAMLDELEADWIMPSGLKLGIDNLRNEVESFASTMSLTSGRKYVLYDEADALTPAAQDALRSFIEQFSSTTGFIFTCNYKNKLIEPIHSRCAVIDFKVPTTEAPSLAVAFLRRVCTILSEEGVAYDTGAVAELVKKWFPDFRRTLNELQRYSKVTGKIDVGVLSALIDESTSDLLRLMRAKDYTGVRKWVSCNSHLDQTTLFRGIYDSGVEKFTPDTLPAVILILGKYLYQAAFSADPEINTMCCLTEIMIEGNFK